MKYLNTSIQVSNYAINTLNETLKQYGEQGFELVSVVKAKDKHDCDVMYLFFTKEYDEEIDHQNTIKEFAEMLITLQKK